MSWRTWLLRLFFLCWEMTCVFYSTNGSTGATGNLCSSARGVTTDTHTSKSLVKGYLLSLNTNTNTSIYIILSYLMIRAKWILSLAGYGPWDRNAFLSARPAQGKLWEQDCYWGRRRERKREREFLLMCMCKREREREGERESNAWCKAHIHKWVKDKCKFQKCWIDAIGLNFTFYTVSIKILSVFLFKTLL